MVAQREEALAKQLAEMKSRKRKLVDPLQFEMSIQAEDLPDMCRRLDGRWAPPSDKQKKDWKSGDPSGRNRQCRESQSMLLDRLDKRRRERAYNPETDPVPGGQGFQHVGHGSLKGQEHD